MKISISIREFCKISILLKHGIDKDLENRRPLCVAKAQAGKRLQSHHRFSLEDPFKVSDKMFFWVFQWPKFAMRTFFVGSDDWDGGQKESPPSQTRPTPSIFSHVLARQRIIPRIQPRLSDILDCHAFSTLDVVQVVSDQIRF